LLFSGNHFNPTHCSVGPREAALLCTLFRVPFEPDVDTAKAIALRALVAAALNPNGETRN
jgi:hypothetical protein